jgi:CheY-like chemotaxis protein
MDDNGRTQPIRGDAQHSPCALSVRRILIVDDHADAAEGLGLLLGLYGYETQMAGDGMAALDIARTFLPDLVLLDIGLPQMNGYELAKRLRDEHGRTITLVALTGYTREADRREAETAGFDHFMVKPISVEDLTAFLNSRESSHMP